MITLKTINPTDSRSVFAINQSDHVDVRILTADTHKSHTIPAEAKFVLFSADNPFYCKLGDTATIPTGDITDGSGSERNPAFRAIGDATTIGLISETANKITMLFYK